MKTTSLFVICLVISCDHFTAVAQTWTKVSTPFLFTAGSVVATSANGCKLAASSSTCHAVYTSADSGNTWQTNQSPGQGCFDLASSADGTNWLASVLGESAPPSTYLSTNSGINWTATTVTGANEGVASSALGNILAAGDNAGHIYVSTNSGLKWTTNAVVNKELFSVASSADGTKLAVAAYNDKIYVSTNFGATWTPTQSGTSSWFSVACSADGTKLIASGNSTYISTNFGGQWTLANTNAGYVASSADGTKLVIAGTVYSLTQSPNRSIYTSIDSGVTWVSNNAPALGWSSVASSADGSELVATTGGYGLGSGMWIGRTTPSPQITAQLTSSNLVLSWLVPSSNFVLQQNSDLTTVNWVTLTNTPTFIPLSLQNQVTLPYANSSQGFFRLSAQ